MVYVTLEIRGDHPQADQTTLSLSGSRFQLRVTDLRDGLSCWKFEEIIRQARPTTLYFIW